MQHQVFGLQPLVTPYPTPVNSYKELENLPDV